MKRTVSTLLCALALSFTCLAQSEPLEELYSANTFVRALASSGSSLFLGGDFTSLAKSTGGFAVAGSTTSNFITEIPPVAGNIKTIVSDGSTGWYVGGEFLGVGSQTTIKNLAHILEDGTIDTAFLPNPDGIVRELLLSGGVLYVGGEFTNISGTSKLRLAALNPTTAAVSSWAPNPNAPVYALGISGSTLYVGGNFSSIGGSSRAFIGAVDTSTGLATSWNPGTNGLVIDLAVAGTNVYIAGNFSSAGGSSRATFAEIDGSGTATSFDPNPDVRPESLLSDGTTLYVAGVFTSIASTTRRGLASFTIASNSITSWDPAGSSSIAVYSLALSGTDIIAGGAFSLMNGAPVENIASIDASTGVLVSFLPSVHFRVHALAVSASGNVGIGGIFPSVGAKTSRNYLAALDKTTGLPTSFNPAPNLSVHAMKLVGSTLYVAGRFTQVGGVSRTRLAAINITDGTLLSIPNVSVNNTINTLDVVDNTLYIGGTFTSVGGSTRNRLAAIDLVGGGVTSWDPGADGEVRAIAASASEVYVGGLFANVGGAARARIAKLDTSLGTAISGWNPSASGSVLSLLLDNSTLYVGGLFGTIASTSRTSFAALDTTTGAASSLNPGPSGEVNAMALRGSNLYLAGSFVNTTQPSTAEHKMVAVVNTNTGSIGSLNTKANPNGTNNAVGYALLVSSNSVYVGGDFNGIFSQPFSGIAVADATLSASVDPTITGSTIDGATLTNASLGTWEGVPEISYTRQWHRCAQDGSSCAAQSGETGSTYTLTSNDVGSTIKVEVTATDSLSSATATSSASSIISPLASAAPTISGSTRVTDTLTTSDGSWNGATGLTFAYGWKRCDTSGGNCSVISGANSSSYTLTSSDLGSTVRSFVTASKNGSATTTSSDSSATSTITAAPCDTTKLATVKPTVSKVAGKVRTYKVTIPTAQYQSVCTYHSLFKLGTKQSSKQYASGALVLKKKFPSAGTWKIQIRTTDPLSSTTGLSKVKNLNVQ